LLAVAGCITGVVGFVYFLAFRVGVRGVIMGLYAVSVPVVLFLMAVLCFLIYEEYWRVDGKVCSSFGPVDMVDCDEGDTARGYRDLCWVVISLIACTTLGLILISPKAFPASTIFQRLSVLYRFDIQLHAFLLAMVVIGVVVYTYFITLMIYQVSCGESSWEDSSYIPPGKVNSWSFHEAERVLVFFTVGMVLWSFSLLIHTTEYVTAVASKVWATTRPAPFRITKALYPLFRYHLGSVLLAAVIIPVGRLPRNLMVGLRKVWKKAPVGPLDYMTSDALCYQAIRGGGSFFRACKRSKELAENSMSQRDTLNAGNSLIWLFQLVVLLVAPVYVMYWIQHKSVTYRGKFTQEISSVLAMGIYALVLTWFLAGLLGSVLRGLLHGSAIMNCLADPSKPPQNFFDALEDFTKKAEIHPSSPSNNKPLAPPPLTQEEPSKNEDVSVPPPTPPSRQDMRRGRDEPISQSGDQLVPEDQEHSGEPQQELT